MDDAETRVRRLAKPRHLKPKLPVNLGGTFMPNSENPTTSLWSARLRPEHQSGEMIATNIPEKYVRYLEKAINMHDELVEALGMIFPLAESWADGKSSSHPDHEAIDAARSALAKATTPVPAQRGGA